MVFKNMDTNHFFCHDLPSFPVPEKGKILVTGATGYIGGRLVPELIERGYDVRVMVRAISPADKERWGNGKVEIVVADVLDVDSLRNALDGVYAAYYLIHSMLLGKEEFQAADKKAAQNFAKIAHEKKVARIIYLGGLGDTKSALSPHLRSRIEVANELMASGVSVTILRAAVIIGSGSASYEIIKNLATNLLVIPLPHWAKNRCQPIGIRDVIKALVGVLETNTTKDISFDIGGSDILTYGEMIQKCSEIFGKKRVFISLPITNIKFLAYTTSLLTPVPTPIVRSLLEGLKNEVICECDALEKILPYQRLSYAETVLRAMSREEQDRIHTRWSDAYPPAHELALKLSELIPPPEYTSSYSLSTEKTATALFKSICEIGGEKGWFNSNWMWQLRGAIDKVLLGVGTTRGRKSASTLRATDVVDFWRVERLEIDELLLLRAEMKLPGRAWLEFRIEGEKVKKLHIKAYYQTQSFFGKIYWYTFLPFHDYIFNDLIKQIAKKS